MNAALAGTLNRTDDCNALVVVRDLPGHGAELRTNGPLDLAGALIATADVCESRQVNNPRALGRTREHEFKPGVVT